MAKCRIFNWGVALYVNPLQNFCHKFSLSVQSFALLQELLDEVLHASPLYFCILYFNEYKVCPQFRISCQYRTWVNFIQNFE